MKARHVANFHAWEEGGEQRGDFWFTSPDANGDTHLLFACPGCGEVHGVSVASATTKGRWTWNGDRETPDVNPSIQVSGGVKDCRWHGWLRNGVFVDA